MVLCLNLATYETAISWFSQKTVGSDYFPNTKGTLEWRRGGGGVQRGMWEGEGGSQARLDDALGPLLPLTLILVFFFCENLLRPRGDFIVWRGFALVPTKCPKWELLIWKTFNFSTSGVLNHVGGAHSNHRPTEWHAQGCRFSRKSMFFSPLKTHIKGCTSPCHLPLPIHHFPPLIYTLALEVPDFDRSLSSTCVAGSDPVPCTVDKTQGHQNPIRPSAQPDLELASHSGFWLPSSFLAPWGFLNFLVCYIFPAF